MGKRDESRVVEIPFLRACLVAWHEEIEKKPPEMSIEQACAVLEIDMQDQ